MFKLHVYSPWLNIDSCFSKETALLLFGLASCTLVTDSIYKFIRLSKCRFTWGHGKADTKQKVGDEHIHVTCLMWNLRDSNRQTFLSFGALLSFFLSGGLSLLVRSHSSWVLGLNQLFLPVKGVCASQTSFLLVFYLTF